MRYKIYTDGAVSGNGSKDAIGGWAFIIVDENNNEVCSNSGQVIGATNQQMELMAISRACTYVRNILNISMVDIYSDSAYAINCYEKDWWVNWENNGWKNSKKEPVANKELWEELIPYFKNPCFCFYKVKGHDKTGSINSQWNNYVDKLAVEAKLK